MGAVFGLTRFSSAFHSRPGCRQKSLLRNFWGLGWKSKFRKNPHAHKNKIGTSTPPSKKRTTPPPPPPVHAWNRYNHTTMWQIGVLTGKLCIFWYKMGHFRHFCTTKTRETLEGFGRKMAHSFYLSKKQFSIGIYSTNKASEWLWRETWETPQNGQSMHGPRIAGGKIMDMRLLLKICSFHFCWSDFLGCVEGEAGRRSCPLSHSGVLLLAQGIAAIDKLGLRVNDTRGTVASQLVRPQQDLKSRQKQYSGKLPLDR